MAAPRLQRALRITLVGAVVNCLLAGLKLAAGLAGRSEALVADAVESFADLAGSFIVWRGLQVAARPADAEHPWGHGKAESIAAAFIATVLLLAALGIAVRAGGQLFQRVEPPAPWTLAVLLGVIVVKELLFRLALREALATGSPAVAGDAWHHRSDAITSFAAALGITLAWLGGPAWAAADNVAALFAAGLIAWSGWRLLRPALEDLMDTVPEPAVTAAIHETAAAVPGVRDVEKVLLRRSGWQLLADMHVRVDPAMTVAEAHRIAHAVKDAIRLRHPQVRDVLVHVEPASGGSGLRHVG